MNTSTLPDTRLPTREQLAARLLALPAEIRRLENLLLSAEYDCRVAASRLQMKEDELLTSGAIDGKNAETRAAQMRQHTEEQKGRLLAEEDRVSRARVELRKATNEFASLRAIARLLGGGSEL